LTQEDIFIGAVGADRVKMFGPFFKHIVINIAARLIVRIGIIPRFIAATVHPDECAQYPVKGNSGHYSLLCHCTGGHFVHDEYYKHHHSSVHLNTEITPRINLITIRMKIWGYLKVNAH